MTVMISGGSGLLSGLALAEALLARGETVVVFALDAPPGAALRRFAMLPGQLRVELGDVRDAAAFAACLRRHGVNRLFPFAAITPGPDREREMPERIIEVNLLGFVTQLRAARDAGVGRVIAPSSNAVYGESQHGAAPLSEADTPCVPISVYGVTKYAVERAALRLGALWNMDVIAARIASVFGPWERDTGTRDLLGPHWALARAAIDGGEAVLPEILPNVSWVYARDVASALLHLLDLPAPDHRVFNIGSGLVWGEQLRDWATLLAAEYPKFSWRQSSDSTAQTIRPGDRRPRATVDISRITGTGWAPRFPPAAAYPDYLRWLHAHADAL